jgi:hypothetical protein
MMGHAREIIMNTLSRRYFGILVLLLVLLPGGQGVITGQHPGKDGALVVLVTWGDVNNTPANDVYVEAYGFVDKYYASKSFILKTSRAGQYEASIPPGIYDVFISEGGSVPRCRRVLIRPEMTTYWTLKLEIDDVYTNQMRFSRK